MNGLGTACTVFTSRVLGSPYVQEQNDPARQVQHVAAQSKDVHRHDAFSWPGRLFLVGIMAAASKQERRMLDDAEKLPKENLSPILICERCSKLISSSAAATRCAIELDSLQLSCPRSRNLTG